MYILTALAFKTDSLTNGVDTRWRTWQKSWKLLACVLGRARTRVKRCIDRLTLNACFVFWASLTERTAVRRFSLLLPERFTCDLDGRRRTVMTIIVHRRFAAALSLQFFWLWWGRTSEATMGVQGPEQPLVKFIPQSHSNSKYFFSCDYKCNSKHFYKL